MKCPSETEHDFSYYLTEIYSSQNASCNDKGQVFALYFGPILKTCAETVEDSLLCGLD